jgi:Protein of unknown function (DUF2637)
MKNNGAGGAAATTGDHVIGWAATISVVVVTAIAAVISYGHARELVLRYGVTGWTADALPLTVDGLAATCSLIMVDCARHGRNAPWHAWALLITGACATVAANVAAGLSHGLVGAVIAGWPALVACGCFDLLLRHRRHRAPTTAKAPAAGTTAPSPVPLGDLPVPAGTDPPSDPAVARARDLYAPRLAAGVVPSIRAIKHDLHVGTHKAGIIQAAIRPAPTSPRQQAA